MIPLIAQASSSDHQGLIQTIAILAAALVFVTKMVVEMWAKRKNGGDAGFLTQNQRDRYLSDLERSHRPVVDPITGQPKYPWYEDSQELVTQMRKNEESNQKLAQSIDALNNSMQNCQERCRAFYETQVEAAKKPPPGGPTT